MDSRPVYFPENIPEKCGGLKVIKKEMLVNVFVRNTPKNGKLKTVVSDGTNPSMVDGFPGPHR